MDVRRHTFTVDDLSSRQSVHNSKYQGQDGQIPTDDNRKMLITNKCVSFVGGQQAVVLVLLRIPSSRPSPRTFPQFVRVQVLGFLVAANDGFET